MKEERELRNKSDNTETPRPESRPSTVKSSTTCIVFKHDDIVKEKEAKCEISSFPLPANDSVDGVKPESGARPVTGNTHEARWCMISAVLHMKRLTSRKAKSVQELKKIPLTTQELEKLRERKGKNAEDDVSDEEPDPYAYLKNCRYLRGKNRKDEHELTIEEIFS